MCWVSAAAEVLFRVEGYDDNVDGSRVKTTWRVWDVEYGLGRLVIAIPLLEGTGKLEND